MSEEMTFGKDFIFGAATAAYQIEGGAHEDGKGLNIWDVSCRQGKIYEKQTADVGCDHYHRYKEDVAIMKELGIKHYRFSIDWARLIPGGTGKINDKGADFYNRLIDELCNSGITPYLTLYHWDLPYELYKKGGFLNGDFAKWFNEYTYAVVKLYSDRVKNYFTFNEPECIIGCGYMEGNHSPFLKLDINEVLSASHNLLLANGLACMTIRDRVKDAKVGMAHACAIAVPQKKEDEEAVRELTFSHNGSMFNNCWFLDPVIFGKYPEHIIKGFNAHFEPSDEDMKIICQPQDFIALNIYQGKPCAVKADGKAEKVFPSYNIGKTAMGWNMSPESLYYGSKYFFERYNLPIVISENGVALTEWKDLDGEVKDYCRIDFIKRYLRYLKKAVDDGIDVRGYFYWSLLDNFEWTEGFSKRFGLIHVDYDTLERTKKSSALFYKRVIETRGAAIFD